jgi:drug/metabolite transporter (DMT)-like permease
MPATSFRENLLGIGLLVACNLLFLINDTFVKLAGDNIPLTEVLFLRGAFASLLLLPIVVLTGAHRHVALLWRPSVMWRTAGELLASLTYLLSLFHTPIAHANTIAQIVPLMVTACGAIFLREVVGWRRWTAIVVGFIGVLIVVRPGFEGFTAYSLLTVASAFFITLRDMTTRLLPPGLPMLLIALFTALVVCLAGPLVAPVLGEVWVVPTGRSVGLAFCAVFFLIGGYLTAIGFMRHGEISVVAPFRYTVIIFAILIGFIVWGEVPDWPMVAGIVVIAASGIYTFSRERNLARLREKALAGEGL